MLPVEDLWPTIAFSVTSGIVFLLTVLLLCQQKKLLAIWTKSEYLAISSLGIIFIFVAHIIQALQSPIPRYELGFFHGGVNLFYWPLIVRSWRIVAIHSTTFSFDKCSFTDGSVTIRPRNHGWLLLRMGLPLCYPLVFSILGLFDQIFTLAVVDWILEGYDIFTIACLIVVTVWHACIRRKITYMELNESLPLLVACILSVLYFFCDLAWWFFFLKPNPAIEAYYTVQHLITLIGLSAIFASTVGLCLVKLICARSSRPLTHSLSPVRVGASSVAMGTYTRNIITSHSLNSDPSANMEVDDVVIE